MYSYSIVYINCSGDRVHSAACQFCFGHYSADDFTDYLSVSQNVYQADSDLIPLTTRVSCTKLKFPAIY